MDKIRLLIASEDSSSGRGLTTIFCSESMFDVIGSFSLEEANEKSVCFQPDVILLDVLGDITKNVPLIVHFKNECPCSLILVLIGNDQFEKLGEILAHGVDGCIPRGIIRGCLVKTVELACRSGLLCLPGSIKNMVTLGRQDKVLNVCNYKNTIMGTSEVLTRREMEILQLMAKNYSNKELASKLFISEPTVKTHVSSILRKLGQNNRAQAVVYSYRNGLVNDLHSAQE